MNDKQPIIGIIGGNGGMGGLFNKVFKKQGYETLVSSRSTSLTPVDCAKRSDILIVTVPIKNTSEVIKQVGPYLKSDGLLMDFTSLKEFPIKVMLESTKADVLGCHPVFGPRVETLNQQVVVLTPARGDRWLTYISDILKKEGAIIKVTSAQKHDEIMAIVQGLMHFTSISLVDSLKNQKININEINNYSSPVYRIRMDFVKRILNQDPELYADIELLNPRTEDVLESYIKSCQDLLDIIKEKKRDDFIGHFKQASTYLGSDKELAEKKTDRIIDYISQIEKKFS